MPPATPTEPIARPRVEDRLRAGLGRGPVLLVAPAGWGKTAALAAALRGREGPVVWHACGRRDADPGRLLVGVLRALRREVPGAADALLEQLGAPGDAVEPLQVAEALLLELEDLLVEPLVLVLDDAERLGDDDATRDVLEALLDADPVVLRLAVAARRRPPVPLGRREAAGRLLTFGRDDLRFDHDECAALLARRAGTDPGDEAVLGALQDTGGWPLGLAMGLEGGEARVAAIESFVTEEVLDGLPAADRAALLDASVEETPAAGAGALRDAPDGLLELAAHRGLTTRAAADGEDVRWHPLVREALQSRWRAERPPDARAALLARVADDLLAAGRPADAVDRLLEAGRPADALPAMLIALPETLRAAPGTVLRWVEALPGEVRASADARWLEARLAVAEGRMVDAAARYVAAFSALDEERRDLALLGVMECTYFVGDLALAVSLRHVLEDPESLAGRPVALLASAWWGINRAAHGETAAGAALAHRAFALPGGAFARQFEVLLQAHATLVDGGHDPLRERLIAIEADGVDGDFPEWMASIRGFVETDVGHRDEAVRQARRMVRRADRDGGSRHWQTLGTVQHGWALAIAGRWAEATAVLTPLHGAGFDGWPRCWIDAGLALVADGTGDPVAAREHAERALRLGEGAPLFLRHLLVLDVAAVLARADAEDRAAAVLDETLATLDARIGPARGTHPRARLRAQRAWLRHRTGDPAGARDDLRAALAGGPDVVRAEWGLIGPLVREALEDDAAGDGESPDPLDPERVVALVDRAFSGGPEVLAFAAHPAPGVRAAAVPRVAASGHPSATGWLKALAADADAEVAARAAAAGGPSAVTLLPLRVRLFGGFEVRRGAWPVDERAWGRPTAPRLVRFLLVHRGALVPQDRILEALWPDRPADAAKGQLQVAVSRARAVLDPPGTAPADSALIFRDGGYRLTLRDGDTVDTEAFAVAAANAGVGTSTAGAGTSAESGASAGAGTSAGAWSAAGAGAPAPRAPAAAATADPARRAALEHAAARWTGDPLPEERYAEWADAWTEDLRETLHRVLRALAAEQRVAGDEPAVAATARRLLELDPLDEGAHRDLMRAHARTGRPALALRQFLACRRALIEGLGVEPSAETAAIQAAVLAGRAV